jgi:hypothetical protein
MALRELAVAVGEPAWRLLGDGPEFVPETFWQSGGDFADDPEQGFVAAAPGEQERWKDLVVSADDCVGHWQAPGSVLGQGRMPMSRVLPTEPDDVPQWLLAHPDVVVTGVDGSGTRVAIERGLGPLSRMLRRRPVRSSLVTAPDRFTLLPVITVIGIQVGGLIAFSIITETVFQWPGMGQLFIQSVQFADIPVMAAYLVMVSLIFVTINFFVDLLYAAIDPRLRLDRARVGTAGG